MPTKSEPVSFHGFLLADCSTRRQPEDPFFAERWFDLAVYSSTQGEYFVSIRYSCLAKYGDEHDLPHHSVFRCKAQREVENVLRQYDFRQHIAVNYVPDGHCCFIESTERYVEDLMNRCARAVADLVTELDPAVGREP